jgi:hypothetical protein
MNSVQPLQWAGIVLGLGLVLYLIYSHLQYFRDVSLLGGILLLEIIIASLWNYGQRFFVLLMITFVWAGMHVPLQSAWTGGRWVVLSAGAVVGYIIWTKNHPKPSGLLHLIAFFCICTAFVSATVSPFVQMASLKALSLFLLFLYCACGARLSVLGREDRFFRGLLWGSEIAVYATAICYLGLGQGIWGNPNSLGAAMSIGLFPVLLWGWLTSDTGRPAALHVPCANQHGACCDGFGSGRHVCFLCQPAPIQIAGEGRSSGSVPGGSHWDVRSGSLKQVAGGPEGCSAL